MEKIIRNGTLKLEAAETSCDVILNCQGQRLMAHKLILSIASPVFRELLRDDNSEASLIILPDINRSTMSLILDYIYSGSVVIYPNTIQEFLSVAKLLKIHLDLTNIDTFNRNINGVKEHHNTEKKYNPKENEQREYHHENKEMDLKSDSEQNFSPTTKKKIPNLIPINKEKKHHKLSNYVIPSPWCPRIDRPLLADPRTEYIEPAGTKPYSPPRNHLEENDSNNNFQFAPLHPLSGYFPTKLNEAIKNLYLNSTETKSLSNENITLPVPFQTNTSTCLKEDAEKSPQRSESETVNDIFCTDKFKPFRKRSHEMITAKSRQDVNSNKTLTNHEDTQQTSAMNLLTDESALEKDVADKTVAEVGNKFEKRQEKEKPYKCEDCGKCFSQLRNYKYHRSLHEGTKEFSAKCTECGKVFNDRGYLSSHMKIHRDKKEYACPHCPKRFNQRVAYNMHLRIHTGVKPHECPTCGKSFSRKMLLKQHQRVHTGERPYSCPECGKTFADRSNMSLHARLHTGIKPYSCNICPKSFTKKHHLKTHMNFHTGLKPYTCEKCGLAFSQSSNMRTHYKKCVLKDNSSSSSCVTTVLENL